MAKKKVTEWFIKAFWGKIAVVSWGEPTNPPILLVHGFMDTAATFIPLVDLLPDLYYYVGLDYPGHGKSDPFPPGLLISLFAMVEVKRKVVEFMKWDKFMFITHSMSFLTAAFYNILYPGKVLKVINLDPGPSMAPCHEISYKPHFSFTTRVEEYYKNYNKWTVKSPRQYTYEQAVSLMARNRHLSKEKAEIILSRSLVPADHGKYSLSWEPRMKKLIPLPFTEKSLYGIIATNTPPMLSFISSENSTTEPERIFANYVLDKCQRTLPNFVTVKVTGGHDVHITNPELFVRNPRVRKFDSHMASF